MKIAAASLAAALLVGCGNHGAIPAAGQAAQDPVTSIAFDDSGLAATTPATVGVRLIGERSAHNANYGTVLGYFKGKMSTLSQVVSLRAGTKVQFANVDSFATHTASFLGNATATSAPWPASFSGGLTVSPAGTAIGTANFSTGPLGTGKTSLVYSSGMPGFYMIGCHYHYTSNKMRTIIIVH